MPRRKPDQNTTSSEGSSGNQLLALSLFIMLLAFFIILNALSTYEQTKSRPVIESIEAAFSSKISQRNNLQPSMTPQKEKDISEGDTFEKLEALFRSQIPAHEATVSRRKGIMHVEMPYQDFKDAVFSLEQSETAQQTAQKRFFISALVALTRNERAEKTYRMDIMLNIGENPAALEDTDPAGLRKSMRDLAGLAEKIISAGLSERFMSIGIEKGDPETVELLFRPHVPYDPTAGRDTAGSDEQ